MTAADYDLDGDLDIYVSRYFRPRLTWNVPNPVPCHDVNNGPDNRLLRNDEDWRFTDIISEFGMDIQNRKWSPSAPFRRWWAEKPWPIAAI